MLVVPLFVNKKSGKRISMHEYSKACLPIRGKERMLDIPSLHKHARKRKEALDCNPSLCAFSLQGSIPSGH